MSYSHLRQEQVITTLDALQARIDARFPDSGLASVCRELTATDRWTAADAADLARPRWRWRIVIIGVIVLGIAAQIAAARYLQFRALPNDPTTVVTSLEAAVNLLILFAGAVWFLLTIEERMKRQRALDAFYRLRSLAHIIDMHQLTKDPIFVLNPNAYTTPVSPQRRMSRFELNRYLDYCTEMLALIGKLAALYAERMRDGVVIDAVNDIENLTSNLSRKIWQKITIISALDEKSET